MSTVDFAVGIFIGYLIGVIKEKLKWIEKYVSSRRSRQEVKKAIEEDE